MKKLIKIFALLMVLFIVMLTACNAIIEDPEQPISSGEPTQTISPPSTPTEDQEQDETIEPDTSSPSQEGSQVVTPSETLDSTPSAAPETTTPATPAPAPEAPAFSLSDVPAYSGKSFVVLNNHQPYFTADEITNVSFERYSPLDSLGRCGAAFACVGIDIMPTEERGSIGMVKPSGWHTVRYNGVVDGNYLYNRCHLIGYQLTGENANVENLITGTRYLNIEGMLPFENLIAEYVEDTGNHVLYRVTPIFEGDNLLAAGVLMEGISVEDNGANVRFCVFAYNVQPGVTIDYATGESHLTE